MILHLDCEDAFQNGERDPDATYYITAATTQTRYRVKCVFDGFNGWTVIQRRYDGSTDFERWRSQYYDGFGKIDEEHWIGMIAMHKWSAERRFLFA